MYHHLFIDSAVEENLVYFQFEAMLSKLAISLNIFVYVFLETSDATFKFITGKI